MKEASEIVADTLRVPSALGRSPGVRHFRENEARTAFRQTAHGVSLLLCEHTRLFRYSESSPGEREYPGDEIVDRAWKAIILGIMIAPLFFYALYLIGEARNAVLSDHGRRKLRRTQMVAYYWAVFVIIAITIMVR